jgi:hypothetical protein
MRTLLPVLLFACTAEGPFADLEERPEAYQPPPGSQQMTLDCHTAVRPFGTFSFTATMSDLEVGDRVDFGWGGEEGAGPCAYQGQTGGLVCMDIRNPARYAGTATAELLPDGSVGAVFTSTFPQVLLDTVYLQALHLNGPFSATSNVLELDVQRPGPCPYGPNDDVTVTHRRDLRDLRGCEELGTLLFTGGITDVSLEFLRRVDDLNIRDAPLLQYADFPSLTTVDRSLHIQDNRNLIDIALPRVAEVRDVRVERNDALTSFALPDLARVGYGLGANELLHINGNASLTSASFPILGEIGATFRVEQNPVLDTLEVPVLRTVGNHTYVFRNAALPTLPFPSLESIGDFLFIIDNDAMTSMQLGSLTNVAADLSINSNSALCVDDTYDWNAIVQGTVGIISNLCNGTI